MMKTVMSPSEAPMADALKQLELDFEQGPGITTTFYCSGQSAESHTLVPARELAVVVQGVQKAFMKLQQKRMKSRQR